MTISDAGQLAGILAAGGAAIRFAIAGVRFFANLSTAVTSLTESVQKLDTNLERVVDKFGEKFEDHEARLRVLEDRTDD